MHTGYHYLYKYLILYIVLSFIDNKHLINCDKVKGHKSKMQDLTKDNYERDLTGGNGTNSIQDTSAFSNYSALAQRSDFETNDGERKFNKRLMFLFLFP